MVVNILQFQYLVSVVNHKLEKTKKKTVNYKWALAKSITNDWTTKAFVVCKEIEPEFLQLLNFNTPEVE